MSAAYGFADERTEGERRALREKDEAEARLDFLAAYAARLNAANRRAVRAIAEAVAAPGMPGEAQARLCVAVIDLIEARQTRLDDGGPAAAGGEG